MSAAAFHCDALNAPSWLDAPADLHGHAHGHAHGMGGGACPLASDFAAWREGGGVFSFCRYPFLYAPAAKARLLALECAARQRVEYSGALFRAFLGGGASHPDGFRVPDRMSLDSLASV